MEIDLTDLHGSRHNRLKRANDILTSLVAGLIVVLICLVVIGGLAWVAQTIWRSVLTR